MDKLQFLVLITVNSQVKTALSSVPLVAPVRLVGPIGHFLTYGRGPPLKSGHCSQVIVRILTKGITSAEFGDAILAYLLKRSRHIVI